MNRTARKHATDVVRLDGLRITRPDDGRVLVRDTTLRVGPGDSVGIVGESGSGKSLTLRALARIAPTALRVDGTISCTARVALIFQEPATALNPTTRVGDLVSLVWRRHHRGCRARDADAHALDLFERVGIASAKQRLRAWPHELSGGMRQRVMIAAALATEPEVLLCDEPTTALDVRIQAQILDLLTELVSSRDMAMLFVSHDLAVVSRVCERLIVMRDGEVVESGATADVIATPRDGYTAELLAANLARRLVTVGQDRNGAPA
ncbi:MAG: ABC transporter ATP-binding protein [Nocardioidaceae bacterium]